mmetsp:Transcript_29690/g.88082  ORF Transcript_29690/g.88082 Transcript_29690/m.88082 type:complete len:265 (-) Transcript_29690:1572-2366(-)
MGRLLPSGGRTEQQEGIVGGTPQGLAGIDEVVPPPARPRDEERLGRRPLQQTEGVQFAPPPVPPPHVPRGAAAVIRGNFVPVSQTPPPPHHPLHLRQLLVEFVLAVAVRLRHGQQCVLPPPQARPMSLHPFQERLFHRPLGPDVRVPRPRQHHPPVLIPRKFGPRVTEEGPGESVQCPQVGRRRRTLIWVQGRRRGVVHRERSRRRSGARSGVAPSRYQGEEQRGRSRSGGALGRRIRTVHGSPADRQRIKRHHPRGEDALLLL